MRRYFYMLYSGIAYLTFLGAFTYLIGFTGNLIVPRGIDGESDMAIGMMIAIDLGLVALFGLQHSIMARPTFKAWWTRIIPQPIERSTFVLFTNLILILTFIVWQPISGTVWNVEFLAGRIVLYGLFGLGWGIAVFVSFLINHFELFGVTQVYNLLRNTESPSSRFVTPILYQFVRHPMQLGMMMGLWAIPHMTVGHLLFAVSMSIYILIGVYFEERNLVDAFGDEYEAYRENVPKLMPRLGHKALAK